MGSRQYDAVAGVAMKALTVSHRTADRLTGGRFSFRLGHGVRSVWLHHRGRRTAEPRRTPLVAARDGATSGSPWVVTGSGGGREAEPAWSLNLRAHAERGEPALVEVAGEISPVRVELLSPGQERDRCYALLAQGWHGFVSYQLRSSRQLPVFRLHPE